MTSITRRDALMGATAAAVVTGVATAPLAVKAAGNPDADLLALCDRLDAALAAQKEAHRKWTKVQAEAERTVPLDEPWLYDSDTAEQERKRTVDFRHMVDQGVSALSREWNRLFAEFGDLSAAVLRTRARRRG